MKAFSAHSPTTELLKCRLCGLPRRFACLIPLAGKFVQKLISELFQQRTITQKPRRRTRDDHQSGKLSVIEGFERFGIKFAGYMLDSHVAFKVGHVAEIEQLPIFDAEVPFQLDPPTNLPHTPPQRSGLIQAKFAQQHSSDVKVISSLVLDAAGQKGRDDRRSHPLLLDQFHDLGQTRPERVDVRAQKQAPHQKNSKHHQKSWNQPEQAPNPPPAAVRLRCLDVWLGVLHEKSRVSTSVRFNWLTVCFKTLLRQQVTKAASDFGCRLTRFDAILCRPNEKDGETW